MYLYLATDLTPAHGDRLGPDEDERLSLERIPFDEALAAVERGEIVDAKSIVGLLLGRTALAARAAGDIERPDVRAGRRGRDPRRSCEAALARRCGCPGFTATDIEPVRLVADRARPRAGRSWRSRDDASSGYCTPRHDDLTVDPGSAGGATAGGWSGPRSSSSGARSRRPSPARTSRRTCRSPGFTEALGLAYRSSLWLFELAAERAVPPPAFPADVTVRALRPGVDADLDAWLRFMLASFDDHPTPMTWTLPVIEHIHARAGLRPDGSCGSAEPIGTRAKRRSRSRLHPGRRARAGRQDRARSGWSACCRAGAGAAWAASCCAGASTELRERRGAGGIELYVEAANERGL